VVEGNKEKKDEGGRMKVEVKDSLRSEVKWVWCCFEVR
jgi:hypothetical protein